MIVDVLLATYNGEKYLSQQLESLFHQSFQDFTLIIRDDGSTDGTLEIIQQFQQQYPSRIRLLYDMYKNVGATQNFSILLGNSTADYIFFCDQDDVWFLDKMIISLEKIQQTEQQNKEIPALVYSDMQIINERGKILSKSAWKTLKIHPTYFSANRLLIQNIPHGCTVVINKALRSLAFPIPENAILHDHWLALLAAFCGKADFIEQPTMQLRNHAQSLTRKPMSISQKVRKYFKNIFSKEEYNRMIDIRVNQAKEILLRTSSFINYEQTELLKNFISSSTKSGFARKKIFFENKFYRTTFWQTLKLIARA